MPSDRKDSVAAAEAAMAKAYPQSRDRFFALRQLLESAAHADKVAPGAWSVTLKPKGFRLNVGVTEVLVGFPDGIGLNLAARPDEFEPSADCEIFEVNYAVRPGSTRYNGLVSDFEHVRLQLQKPHLAFIDACAYTRSGKPLSGSVNMRFHNPGLMAYARSFVAGHAKVLEATALEPASDELVVTEDLVEGRLVAVLVNAFERNARARKQCIAHYGLACAVCGLEFGAMYGAAAGTYIQVHHITPLSEVGEEYVVDPIRDLRPVCANCHAVIHLRETPYSIKEVKSMLTKHGAKRKDA